MSAIAPHPLVDRWAADFSRQSPAPGPRWLQELRDNAAAEFRSAGLPHRKVEAWKYTPLRLLESRAPAAVPDTDGSAAGTFPDALAGRADAVVDLLDGGVAGSLPATGSGISVYSLTDGVQALEPAARRLLPALDTAGKSRMFAALNTAFLHRGLVLHVAPGANAGKLLLRWAFSDTAASLIANSRVLVLLEEGASLELVEQFESTAQSSGSLNLVTQVDLARGAKMRHTRFVGEPDDALLLTSTSVRQETESSYQYNGFDLGGGLVRHELTSTLAGEGAAAEFNGAFVLDRKRHADNHVFVDHESPGCNSSQFFRGVLGGSSRGVFNGKALIRAGADQSSVHQSNANLLLSGLAEIDTKPELEIYADEVEASHGATVGQLDEEAVFYLRTRGLTDDRARRLLTTAFCRAVTDRLADRELAEALASRVDEVMPQSMLHEGPLE